jgi:hypothetical protein
MPKRIRFHLDEHVDHDIARGLRHRGIHVSTATDAALLGASDESDLEFAVRERRVIFTCDADFLRLAQAGAVHHGIVYSPPQKRSVAYLIRALCLIHDALAPEDMQGRVEYL